MRNRFLLCLLLLVVVARAEESRPNILFITVDDMNHDTPGVFGGPIPDLTPHIDRLAREGRRFLRAHVPVAVCQPSRQCMMTGLFPPANGATGFYPVRAEVPTLQEILHGAGYRLGMLGKVDHLQPREKFPWDDYHHLQDAGQGRNPEGYFAIAREFFLRAKREGRPFFLMANSHDPHRPWPGSEAERREFRRQERKSTAADTETALAAGETLLDQIPAPDRVFSADEISVPPFLPDLPEVREEMAHYYSSARRADQIVGRVLDALRETGLEENTIVVFLSDNGIAMPFAKSNCYFTSTRTPLILRWPGRIAPDTVEAEHFVSGVDLMPTLLEAVALPVPAVQHGRSLLPLLKGERQSNRDQVFTCYNETSARRDYEMRSRQDARYGYIFNAWSDGQKTYRAEPLSGLTFPAMVAAAKQDPALAARVELLLRRVPEEFYDLENDPGALRNLIDVPELQEEIRRARRELWRWMHETGDPLAPALEARLDAAPAPAVANN